MTEYDIICPCENCITLSMCKGRVDQGDIFDLMALTDMCDSFRAFIFPDDKPIITAEQEVELVPTVRGQSFPVIKNTKCVVKKNSRKYFNVCIEILAKSLLKGIEFNANIDYTDKEQV